MQLNIIESRKIRKVTSSHVMWVSVLLLFVLLGNLYLGIVQSNSVIYLLLAILAITPIATNIYGNFEYFPKDFDTIATIHLNEENIIVGNHEIELNSISRIEIEVNDWLGKKVVQNIRPYGSGPKLSLGVNNSLKIHLNDSEQIAVIIQIESKEQFKNLGNWIKSLYDSNIDINEKYDHLRSYGLEHLNYKENQTFKEKYTT